MGEPRLARPAVTAAATAAHWWHAATSAQRAVRREALEHADFYDLAAEMVTTLRSLEGLAEVLAGQVGSYGNGRVLRDDSGADPRARLVRAVGEVTALRVSLCGAVADGERFWSVVGHIGLDLDDLSICSPEGGRS